MTGSWRSAGLLLGLVLLAGCAAVTPPPPKPSPSPTSGVAATQTPSTAAVFDGIATTTSRSYCGCLTLHLLSLDGSQLGQVTLGSNVQPPLEAGPDGLYYVLGDELMRLGADGSTAAVGQVAPAPGASAPVTPGPAQGGLAVAPGGTEWAYLQSVAVGGLTTAQVWLGGPGRTPRLLASAAVAPTPEFPLGWTYQLLGWEHGALVLAQSAPRASPFSSQALEVTLVNPQTGAQTVLSNSANCPVAAVSGAGLAVCFQQGGGQATELVTESQGISTGAWSLSPGTGYGAAVFAPTGAEILFAECPACGASPGPAYLKSQMEVLDPATGSITPLGPPGLVPAAWLSTGQIVATQYTQLSYVSQSSPPESQVVLVAPSGKVTPITDDSSSQCVGVATS